MDVIVHGGAGGRPDDPERRRDVLEEAAEHGAAERVPIEAVVRAVSHLESAPEFNAGVGSAVQSDGIIRTDAGLMTADRSVGAVCSLSGVANPIQVARIVAEETPHVLVAGEAAASLAAVFGIETDIDLWTDRTRAKWSESKPDGTRSDDLGRDSEQPEPSNRHRYSRVLTDDRNVKRQLEFVRERFESSHDPSDHDTVGAVAFGDGDLAAATSTGGRWFALAGRVGDVPQVGSGFYCTDRVAVSGTGAGEDIARVCLSRRVAEAVASGSDAQAGVDTALADFEALTQSTAGLIAIDDRGTNGIAYNSDSMQTARAKR